MNYIVRRPDLTDAILTLCFIAATLFAAINLPATIALIFVVNSTVIIGDRILWIRARRRAFAAIVALRDLPTGVTAVALVIPVRERAL